MMENNQKKSNVTFRIDSKLLEVYKSLCEREGFDMSKRLRKFIQDEINTYKETKLIKVDQIFHRPTTECRPKSIDGIDFTEIINSPRVYILKTTDKLTDGMSVSFFVDWDTAKFKFSLYDIVIIREDQGIKMIECKRWCEEYIDSH